MLTFDNEAPRSRRLRIFAFDPSLAQRTETAAIQEIVVTIPWERGPDGGPLPAGPIGEYIEVVDVDPASGVVYPPVKLDDPNLLAQDGLSPSEGNPQFHQQMVYAVAMATIGVPSGGLPCGHRAGRPRTRPAGYGGTNSSAVCAFI